jgi:hypothetical protein
MKKYLLILAPLAVPFIANAQADAFSLVQQLVNQAGGLVNTALPVVFGLAILAFFWGIARYVFAQSTDGKVDGKNVMIWSLVAIFVMTSLYGIITLAQSTLGITNPTNPQFKVPTITSGI